MEEDGQNTKENIKRGDEKKMSEKKKQKVNKMSKASGITLIALVVTIVVLLILAGITITFVLGENGIINMAQRAADATNNAMQKEQESLGDITNQLQNYLNGGSGEGNGGGDEEIEEPPVPEEPAAEFSRAYGNVDVVFVNKANKLIDANEVPTPTLGEGMVPVKWNEQDSSWYVCQSTDSSWYSYIKENKKWANVMLRDGLAVEGVTNAETATITQMAGKKVTTVGSMFVYVPRYAYRITYTTQDGNTILGYSNSDGIVDKEGAIVEGTAKKGAVKVTGKLGNETFIKYVLHPAFQKITTDELTQANGGWSSELAGIWVAKFEASKNDATASSAGSGSSIKVQPGVVSWRSIPVNDIFTKCKSYNSALNSHMMKNSEWGACAYLSKSIYGINGEIWINPNSNYVTGQAGSSVSASATTSTNAYQTSNGVKASTTGNVYGIYDMSGGAYEYVASYVSNGNNRLTSYGASLVNGSGHLKQVYSKGSSDGPQTNYEANKGRYGDAMYETSTAGSSLTSWYDDSSYFPNTGLPFFHRGSDCSSGSIAGAFFFNYYTGGSSSGNGFRPVLATT